MSIETRIKGKLMQIVDVEDSLSESGKDLIYNVRYYSFGIDPQVIGFEIKHNPSEDVEVLISHIYREIVKIKKGRV
jgi:hypothetical protein